jgi:hypothetical protein
MIQTQKSQNSDQSVKLFAGGSSIGNAANQFQVSVNNGHTCHIVHLFDIIALFTVA